MLSHMVDLDDDFWKASNEWESRLQGNSGSVFVRMFLVVDVVLPVAEDCDLETFSSVLYARVFAEFASPVLLPQVRIFFHSKFRGPRSRSARWPTPRPRFLVSSAN